MNSIFNFEFRHFSHTYITDDVFPCHFHSYTMLFLPIFIFFSFLFLYATTAANTISSSFPPLHPPYFYPPHSFSRKCINLFLSLLCHIFMIIYTTIFILLLLQYYFLLFYVHFVSYFSLQGLLIFRSSTHLLAIITLL